MVTTNPVELAKQGNAGAIAAIINRSLQSRGISVTGKVASKCLTLAVESQEVPNQEFVVDYIKKGIQSLKPQAIDRVIIQGKVKGKVHPVWRDSFDVGTSGSVSNSKHSKEQTSGKFSKLLSTFIHFRELANTALLAGILLVLLFNASRNTGSQTQYWEYTVEGVEDGAFLETMLEMGAEGWDLASARRAISGEGSSSEGLYEIIFKRSISQSQAQKNLENIDILSYESEAESYLFLETTSQIAYHLSEDKLSATFENDLQSTFDSSDNYDFDIAKQSEDFLTITASAKNNKLRSFTAAVAVIDGAAERIICKSSQPSQVSPEAPAVVEGSLQCADGSLEV